MPFPNEHAARIRNPDDFQRDSFRRKNDEFAPGIDVIFGRLKGETAATVQAIRFDAQKFSAVEARKWLKDHDYKPMSFEPASGKGKASGEVDVAASMEGKLAVCSAEVVFAKAAEDDEDDKDKKPSCPTFEMTAYTGVKMDVGGWYLPVVIDMAGLTVGKKSRPILFNHDAAKIVGHSTKVDISDSNVKLSGIISGGGEYAREVAASGANGFPWQASVGVQAKQVKEIKEGDSVSVNGTEHKGPLFLIRKGVLREVSFVPLGADDNTSASVAATVAEPDSVGDMEQENEMGKELEGTGATPASAEAPVNAGAVAVAEIRAEHARVAAITAGCVAAPEIAAQAIKEGWTPEKAELHALKAAALRKEQDSKLGSPAIITGGAKPELGAVKAAVMAGHVPEKALLASLGEKSMEGAKRFRRMGVREIAAVCCAIDGIPAPALGASESDWAKAAFSSTSFSDLLSDSANKTLLAAYNAVPSVARVIARALTAKDFKIHKGIRLTGDLVFKKVENGGEITHGKLGEGSYSYSVDTFGRMIGLTRQDLINDDMGAFMQLPQMFGRGAALAVEQAFWALVIANTGTFFGSGNANYISGATTVLSIDGLSEAVQALEEQVNQDGNPVALQGKYLVVPPALKATAQQLYVSTNIIAGTATAKQGASNIHAGSYEPLSTAYLKAAAKVWYLFGDPADVAAFGIAWLNGVQEPVVEEVAVAPEYLGRCWRGYIDFGVCQVDSRGAVKSKGEA
jgi:hypothetical protein